MDLRAQALIAHYQMTELPIEGTYFVKTWRSREEFADGSPVGTAMIGLYCTDPLSYSTFHRLAQDECWHFYDGDPIRLVLLHPDGTSQDVVLGRAFEAGEHVQYVIPAGTWQGGHVIDGGSYALFGCSLAPGFVSGSFEGATLDDLLARYPDRESDIRRLAPTAHTTHLPPDFET